MSYKRWHLGHFLCFVLEEVLSSPYYRNFIPSQPSSSSWASVECLLGIIRSEEDERNPKINARCQLRSSCCSDGLITHSNNAGDRSFESDMCCASAGCIRRQEATAVRLYSADTRISTGRSYGIRKPKEDQPQQLEKLWHAIIPTRRSTAS